MAVRRSTGGFLITSQYQENPVPESEKSWCQSQCLSQEPVMRAGVSLITARAEPEPESVQIQSRSVFVALENSKLCYSADPSALHSLKRKRKTITIAYNSMSAEEQSH